MSLESFKSEKEKNVQSLLTDKKSVLASSMYSRACEYTQHLPTVPCVFIVDLVLWQRNLNKCQIHQSRFVQERPEIIDSRLIISIRKK